MDSVERNKKLRINGTSSRYRYESVDDEDDEYLNNEEENFNHKA